MAELTAKIEIAGVEEFQDLLDILAANFDALPDDVQNALRTLGEGESLRWGCDYLDGIGVSPSGVTVFADGVRLGDVVALHPFTREVELGGGRRIKAAKAEIRNEGGHVVRGWA